MLDPAPHPEDFQLAQRCLDGDAPAILTMQSRYREPIRRALLAAGADERLAGEMVDGLWADCLAPREGLPPALQNYDPHAPLQGWLKAVAINRLLKFRRDEARRCEWESRSYELESATADGEIAASPVEPAEAPLLAIMRHAITAAFAQCAAETWVLLQLANVNGLKQNELAPMWHWTEAKMSRSMKRAQAEIATLVLEHVRAVDPLLDLRWDDFLELAAVATPACFGLE